MNSVFVYCEIEEGIIADVSLELLTKGRTLATELGVKLHFCFRMCRNGVYWR